MDLPHPMTEPQSVTDLAAADALYYRRVLHELIDMGADLARMVHREAAGAVPAGVGVVVDATTAYDRVCRTVRRSIMLAQRVAEPVVAVERPERPERTEQHRAAARSRIIREVEDTIQREAEDYEAETLEAELLERLDAPDVEDDLGCRPVDEIIAEICSDLGLGAAAGPRPWKRRTPADVAALRARAAKKRVEVAAMDADAAGGICDAVLVRAVSVRAVSAGEWTEGERAAGERAAGEWAAGEWAEGDRRSSPGDVGGRVWDQPARFDDG